LRRSRVINFATAVPQKKARLIGVFFKHKMPPVHEKTMRSCELVNIHSETRGKSLSILFGEINEPRLFAAGAAALTLEV